MATSARVGLSLVVLLVCVAVSVLGRPGPPSYPSEEENIIPDYANDNEDDRKSDNAGSWKPISVANPDKLYDDEVVETIPNAAESTRNSPEASPEASPDASPEATPEASLEVNKVAEVVGAVRAVDVAGAAGAAGAVQAVEVVKAVEAAQAAESAQASDSAQATKAALDTTEVPDTTTTYGAESGRAAGDDFPTPDQSLYGFSKFLHDLLQVPIQVMRSVSSYLSGAFNPRHDAPGASTTLEHDHALTSAMLSQTF